MKLQYNATQIKTGHGFFTTSSETVLKSITPFIRLTLTSTVDIFNVEKENTSIF
jgi:hypothetical protein